MTISENKLFPGRDNYTGPQSGHFGFVHHGQLFEESHNIAERLERVRKEKPPNEIPVRLHNMIFLDPGLCPAIAKRATMYADDYEAKRAPLYAEYRAKRDEANRAKRDEANRVPLDADYRAKRDSLYADYLANLCSLDAKILAYIRAQIPDCAWDEKLRSLVFPVKSGTRRIRQRNE